MKGEAPMAVEAVSAPHDFVVARKSVGTGRGLDEETRAALVPISL